MLDSLRPLTTQLEPGNPYNTEPPAEALLRLDSSKKLLLFVFAQALIS